MIRLRWVAYLLLGVGMVLGNGHHNMSLADEVMESINEAIEYYKEKDYVEAKSSLEYAAQLIGQMRSEGLQAFLPEPLSGWKADEAISQNIGPAMFGGMTGASRNYRKDNGHIKIEIMGDSQMMQGVMAMMANPAYATADGGKLKKIKRQKAVIKYSPSNSNGEITLVVGQKYIVKLEGRQIKEQDLIDYASAIDYKGLKQF